MCSIPIYMDNFDGLCSKEHGRAMGEQRIKREGKTLLDFDYADDLNVPDINANQMNKFLKVLRLQSTRIDLKIVLKRFSRLD